MRLFKLILLLLISACSFAQTEQWTDNVLVRLGDIGTRIKTFVRNDTVYSIRVIDTDTIFSFRYKYKTVNGQSIIGNGNISAGGSTDWADITNKPSTFTPSSHTHTTGDITNFPSNESILSDYARSYRVNKRYDYFNEFINTVTTSSPGNDVQATNSGTAAATSAQATDATNRIGLVRSTTGSTATGRTAVSTTGSAIRLGGGTWVYETSVNIATLSNGTERFQLAIGFIDTYTAANQVDGVYFLYDEGGVSTGSTAATYWQTVTTSNSVRTFNTSLTQTTVNAATWVKLRIEVNAAANSVGFYINDALVSTHTGNIPTGSGRETGFGWLLIKSIGTTARTVDFDFVSVQSDFNSDR